MKPFGEEWNLILTDKKMGRSLKEHVALMGL